MRELAIIILNFRNYIDTIRCVESILESGNRGCAIIVVDNGSQNQSLEHIHDAFSSKAKIKYWNEQLVADAEILLVQHHKNAGYAAGNNVGLRLGYDLGFLYLMVLNNDTLFHEVRLEDMTDVFRTHPDALCVGPLLYKEDGVHLDYNCAKRRPTLSDFYRLSYFGSWFKTRAWEREYYYLKGHEVPREAVPVDLISGSCMLFNAKKLHAIDYYDEGTFLYYEEDILLEKARSQGYRFYFQPKAKIIHLGAKTMKNHSHSSITLKSGYESALYYLTKWRRIPLWKARLVCLSKYVFMRLYLLKKKIGG